MQAELARCLSVSYTAVQMLTPRDLSRLATALGGVPVLGCSRGSPAADAGLRYGDIILASDGTPVASWSELLAVCARARADVCLRVSRAGRELALRMRTPATRTPRGVLGDPAPSAISWPCAADGELAPGAVLDLC